MKKIIVLLPVVFAAACSNNNKPAEKSNDPQPPAAAAYQFTTVKKGGLCTSFKLPAQLAAYEEVSIFPKVNGYVKNVLVDIGSRVKQGQLLMTLEAPELVQADIQAKEKYAKAKSDYILSRENYQRLQEAAQTPGAVSPLDISTARSREAADSALSNAAKADWQMQETMLSYLNITAPFSGVITERNVHPGALVSNAEKDIPMLELKQEDHLRLQIDIPENMAAMLTEKDTVYFILGAATGKKMHGLISRKSHNIDPKFRTERVEIDVMNDGSLAPGMYADVLLSSKGDPAALNVPQSAVVTSTERKYVIVLRNGKLYKTDIITGSNAKDKTEIYGNLHQGDTILVNANDETATVN